MRQKFIVKCVRSFLQDATVLLQNATVIKKHDDFITKCDSYYKMRLYNGKQLVDKTFKVIIQSYFALSVAPWFYDTRELVY